MAIKELQRHLLWLIIISFQITLEIPQVSNKSKGVH